MPRIRQNADGEYEMPMPDGRVMVSEHLPSLERMAAGLVNEHEQTALFLEHWKAGITIAGQRFFQINADSIEAATDKNQIRPDASAVEQGADTLTRSERVFLFALCAFFNSKWAGQLFAQYGETGNVGEVAAQLDAMRSQVIAQLLTSYRGW